MAVLRNVEEAAANARQQGGRKLRWPVQRVVVATDDDTVADGIESLSDLLAERVNARSVDVVSEFDELVERAVPEMSVIGPEFGADAQKVMEAVEGRTRDELEGGVEVDGENYDLDEEMVRYEAEPPEGVSAAEFDGGTVYVDTTLTDDIEAEGYARDVVRRIQEMRKRLDLDVESEIDTAVDVADDRVAEFVDRHREYVAEETRSRELVDGEPSEVDYALVEEWEVEGIAVTIGVDPVGE
jgi:isoleucyl-tRNA synthetase